MNYRLLRLHEGAWVQDDARLRALERAVNAARCGLCNEDMAGCECSGTCAVCGADGVAVDSSRTCYPCFEDAMFAPDEDTE